jgi:uroporphyrin-III C-methyltransferase
VNNLCYKSMLSITIVTIIFTVHACRVMPPAGLLQNFAIQQKVGKCLKMLMSNSKRLPNLGSSLILSFSSKPHRSAVILIGHSKLTSVRCLSALEAGYTVYLAADERNALDNELSWRLNDPDQPVQKIHEFDEGLFWSNDENPSLKSAWEKTIRSLPFFNDLFSIICCDSLPFPISDKSVEDPFIRSKTSCQALSQACRDLRVLCSIADIPELSDFSWCMTERWELIGNGEVEEKKMSALQIAVCTNGKGCRIAGRIRKEIVKVCLEPCLIKLIVMVNLFSFRYCLKMLEML